jgi:hypothetical protein
MLQYLLSSTFRLLVGNCLTLTLCPTAIWQPNSTIIVGFRNHRPGSNASAVKKPTDVKIVNGSIAYVLDAGNYRVQRRVSNSTLWTTVLNSTNGRQLNQFASSKCRFVSTSSPVLLLRLLVNAMGIADNGDLYILDGDNGRVTRWTPRNSSGVIVAGGNGIGNGSDQIDSATGMFVQSSTLSIWIADTNDHRIVKWTSPTASMVLCGSDGVNDDQFKYPGGLFVDTSNADTLYVADTENHRIQLWLPGASRGVTVAGITSYYGDALNQLFSPQALLVDGNRDMFIVDAVNRRILKWSVGASAGTIIAEGQSLADLGPTALDFDSSGTLFVVDSFNNRVQAFISTCRKDITHVDASTLLLVFFQQQW